MCAFVCSRLDLRASLKPVRVTALAAVLLTETVAPSLRTLRAEPTCGTTSPDRAVAAADFVGVVSAWVQRSGRERYAGMRSGTILAIRATAL